MMGSPDADAEADDNEKPAHRVTISQPFYLGKYPVTLAQWATVMGNNQSIFSKVFLRFKGNTNRPIEHVSWVDVQEFIRKLNEREGVTHYCLPTEAQWEYACRAGTETPRYYDDVNAIAWYIANRNDHRHPVGQKMPNAWGLYDMLGNVSEWCHDGWRTYTTDSVVDPIGSTDVGAYRVVRSGCWGDGALLARAGFRLAGHPSGGGRNAALLARAGLPLDGDLGDDRLGGRLGFRLANSNPRLSHKNFTHRV